MKREALTVEKRSIFGKQLKKLRREGILPGNVYGKNMKSTAVQLPLKDFKEVFKIAHETGLVDLTLGKDILPVLIHNVQKDGRTREAVHADFFIVNLKEKITTKVPVVSTGEALAETNKLGLLLQLMQELEIEALPADLPEKIEVNVEKLAEIDAHILVSDITLPTGVTMVTAGDQTVFKVGELVTKEAEAEAVAEEAAAEEAAAETAEGEAPTEEKAEASAEAAAPEESPKE